MLTAEKIQSNYKEFLSRMEDYFPDRGELLVKMYEDLGEAVIMAPASSFDYFHNAFPGGYVDHVLRVHDNAILYYDLWEKSGMLMNFPKEELHFAALHHDLGKLGLPGHGNEHYIPETSDWHRKNQGKMYKTNPNIPKMTTADNTFFLLNHYGIKFSWSEMVGIRCTDGLYDESNGEYLKGFSLETKLRNSLPYILHQADIMAFRFEFERWNRLEGKFRTNIQLYGEPTSTPNLTKPKSRFDTDVFDSLFKDLNPKQ
jgi:hypothetical protein